MSHKPTVAPALADEATRAQSINFEIDVGESFRKHNPDLCAAYGKTPMTRDYAENGKAARFYRQNEASLAHGYPATLLLQGGLLYATAFYTARAQGLPNPHLFFKSHWFDWIQFFKRGAAIGVFGGLVLGTVLFGDTEISLRRIRSRYNRLKYVERYEATEGQPIPFTNK
ncbi:unnamed protein product [Moneuplotes crassus]|uniref:Uncharacterized protein n=1 Tax=Euplotes crassus TaxID=5936 RepID=A0AAD2D5G5_EUPCR|nr:unnamed protein product [Moneuplotes crassus]CAI2381874.1 unnamed protein product [Moneuplotes crassus]